MKPILGGSRMRCPARAAFTLIELLVVIAIVALLSGLLFSGLGLARTRARVFTTGKRIADLLAAAQQIGVTTDGTAAYRLQRDGLGDDLGFQPLRRIVGDMHRISRSDGNAGNDWPFAWSDRDGVWCPPNLLFETWQIGQANIAAWEQRMLFLPAFSGTVFRTYRSPIGEDFSTREVLPPLQRWWSEKGLKFPPKTWYRNRWPHRTMAGGAPTGGWPASTWDVDSPATLMPTLDAPTPSTWVRWDSPWGRGQLDGITGQVGAEPAAHDLGQLSPLHTPTILQAVGVLSAGSDGLATWRSDRGGNRAWNDAWGNPLVVGSAAFVALRHDLVWNGADTNTYANCQGEAKMRETITPASSLPLLRPRDFLLKAAEDAFGYNRSVYLSAGAVGPLRAWNDLDPGRTALSSSGLAARWNGAGKLPAWSADDDLRVCRGLWLQVRRVTVAQDWTSAGFSEPPWQGLRERRSAGQRCLLSAPVEVK